MANMTLWEKDGKIIVDDNGKPIICDRCPCEDLCASYLGKSVGYSVILFDEKSGSPMGELESGSAICIGCSVNNTTGGITLDYEGSGYYIVLNLSSTGSIISGFGSWGGWPDTLPDGITGHPVSTDSLDPLRFHVYV